MASLLVLAIIEFIKRYKQKSSFAICIDDKYISFPLSKEEELLKTCENLLQPTTEGEDGYGLEEMRTDGGIIVIKMKKQEKKKIEEKIEPIIYIDKKMEKLKEKKSKK